MRKRSFFDISDGFTDIVEEIIAAEIEAGKELPDDHPLVQELKQLHEDRGEKHVDSVHAIKHYEAEGKHYRGLSREISAHAKACENAVKRIKEIVRIDLVTYGEVSVEAGDFRISRQKNSAPSVDLTIAPELLPPHLQNVTIEPNNTAIRRAIEAGETVDGAALKWGEHVRIRVGKRRTRK